MHRMKHACHPRGVEEGEGVEHVVHPRATDAVLEGADGGAAAQHASPTRSKGVAWLPPLVLDLVGGGALDGPAPSALRASLLPASSLEASTWLGSGSGSVVRVRVRVGVGVRVRMG